MKLNSARLAWHDCYYSPGDSLAAFAIERARLGGAVQLSEFDGRTSRAVHQAIAGRIQQAINTLPGYIASFGHWMYNPLADVDHKEMAEAAVFVRAYDKSARMTVHKVARARYVAMGVLHRYRRMHQGGQSANVDPLCKPEDFRKWLEGWYGIKLASEAWKREWGGWVDLCFEACDDLDREALAPVSTVIRIMTSPDELGSAKTGSTFLI